VAALTPFITAALLRTALSPSTYIAIFDDDNGGDIAVVDASSQVALCIKRAHVRVVSRLGMLYNKIPDGTDSEISDLLVDAELNYAVGISFDRHPEYVRTFGESDRRKAAFDQADGTMEMIQAAILATIFLSITVITGTAALRSAWRNSTPVSPMPFARAVRTKSSLTVSSTFARIIRT